MGFQSSSNAPMRQPNYVNPPTRGPAVQVTSILFAVLVTLSLILRLYTRGRIKRRLEVDDIFATFATILSNAAFIMQIFLVVVYRQNRHIWDIPPNLLTGGHKTAFIYLIIFAQAVCQSKLSLLFFTRRMIGDVNAGSFYVHYICLLMLMVIVAICQLLFVVITCVACRPLKAAWDPHPTYHYKCFNTTMFISISGIINTTTDFLCTVLPASIVLKLKMPLRKRLIAASLFLVGIFVNVASTLRIYYTYCEYESGDTWNLLPSSVCSNLELGLGLLCVNLPIIRPFITHYTNSNIGYVRSRNENTKYGHNAYAHSQSSELFFSVGDDFRAAAAASSANRPSSNCDGPSLYPWRNKSSSGRDEVIEVVNL